ncbi:MAG TPA: sensor histidine kinase, partial [Gammaproteobacteria bacterium]|nr:sensor histidine kinase [Gammaproteobacteria bacterium]
QVPAEGPPHVMSGGAGSVYDRAYSGHYYVVLTETGKPLRSRSLWDATLAVEPVAPGAERAYRAEGPSDQRLLVLSAGFRKGGERFTIAVAEDLSPLYQSLSRFNWVFAGLTLGSLALLVLLQRLVVRVTFRSLEPARRDIRRLESGEVTALREDVPEELRPFVGEVNRLLRLLNDRLQRSRNSLGNLAHALKGPTNLLLQLGRRPEVRERPELAEELQRQTDRIHRTMERELKRARLAGAGAPGSRFRPADDLPALVETLRRIHAEKDLEIEWSVAPEGAVLNADRDDMLELLGNLLDNACKWAAGRVRCRIETGERTVCVVEDDGPGCSEEDMQRLAQRGVRVDESVPGHGLGLAICRDIVTLYGGVLRFEPSPDLGGLRVHAELAVAGG